MEVRPQFSWFALIAAATARIVLALAIFGSTACGSKDDLVLGAVDFHTVRHDDFDGDHLDADYWEVATHTFGPNLAWFSTNNAKVEDGRLVLSITADPGGTPVKPYSAAEVRTRIPFLYGRFRTRARFASGTGIVSSFWGFYDHYSMPAEPNAQVENQIVIESGIGKESGGSNLRLSINAPASVEPRVLNPGFDPAADFHELGFDWTPTSVTFFVDGRAEQAGGEDVASQLRQVERLVLSAYPSTADWLSGFQPEQLPLTAEFDWVEIAEYKGARQ